MTTEQRRTYRDVLWEIAAGAYGLVSLDDARDASVPEVEVRKLAARGSLERVGHGLYRDPKVPPSNWDQFAWAVRAVGPDAYLMCESVLSMHDLAFVNPARIMVGTPHRIWRTVPPLILATQRNLPDGALTRLDGIAQTTTYQAIGDCLGLVMSDRLSDAVSDAGRRGLLTRREQGALRLRINRWRAQRDAE